jgi:hypothetical protein
MGAVIVPAAAYAADGCVVTQLTLLVMKKIRPFASIEKVPLTTTVRLLFLILLLNKNIV